MDANFDNPAAAITSRFQFFRDVGILSIFLCCAFGALWIPQTSLPKFLLALVIFSWALFEWKLGRSSTSQANLSSKDHYRSLCWVLAFTVVAATAMYLVGSFSGAYRSHPHDSIFDKSAVEWLGVKLPTVLAQQLLLHLILMPLLIRLVKSVRLAIFLGAVTFSMFHLPNPILMLFTLIGGSVWLANYQHSREMLPLVGSHLILAVLAAAFGGEYMLNMRVGASCLDLFPTPISSASNTVWEYPCSSVGCAERLVQTDSHLEIQGWVNDAVHAERPLSIAVRYRDKFVEIEEVVFEKKSVTEFSQAEAAGFVLDECYSFVAKVPLFLFSGQEEFELYACNQNKHWARINAMGPLAKSNFAARQPIVLFPVVIDGRIEKLDQQASRVRVRGWAADLERETLASQIFVQIGNAEKTIQLNQLQRLGHADIAKSYSQPAYNQCGFQFDLPRMSAGDFDRIKFFVQDDQQYLHPLKLTPNANQEKIRLASPVIDNRGTVFR